MHYQAPGYDVSMVRIRSNDLQVKKVPKSNGLQVKMSPSKKGLEKFRQKDYLLPILTIF